MAEAHVNRRKPVSRKALYCSIGFSLASIVLLVMGGLTPYLMNKKSDDQGENQDDKGNHTFTKTQLTQENEDNWKGIPGRHDLGIYWHQYFYNCTNALDVIYRGEKPEFQEFGPYTYRESDSYDGVIYS